jgi:hypothetical protein
VPKGKGVFAENDIIVKADLDQWLLDHEKAIAQRFPSLYFGGIDSLKFALSAGMFNRCSLATGQISSRVAGLRRPF